MGAGPKNRILAAAVFVHRQSLLLPVGFAGFMAVRAVEAHRADLIAAWVFGYVGAAVAYVYEQLCGAAQKLARSAIEDLSEIAEDYYFVRKDSFTPSSLREDTTQSTRVH